MKWEDFVSLESWLWKTFELGLSCLKEVIGEMRQIATPEHFASHNVDFFSVKVLEKRVSCQTCPQFSKSNAALSASTERHQQESFQFSLAALIASTNRNKSLKTYDILWQKSPIVFNFCSNNNLWQHETVVDFWRWGPNISKTSDLSVTVYFCLFLSFLIKVQFHG